MHKITNKVKYLKLNINFNTRHIMLATTLLKPRK